MIKKLKTLTNTENKKRLIGNFMSLVVLRGFQFLIPLITLPYLVRTIGIENFGLVNFALSLGLYFGAIIQFGFGITATREIARQRDDSVKLAQIYSATLSASILLALVSIVLFSIIVLLFEKFNQYLNLYLFTLAFIVFQSLFPIWFFQGMEKMKYITFLNLGANLIFLVMLFICVKNPDDYVLVPLLYAVAAAIIFVFSLGVIAKKFNIHFETPQFHEIKLVYINGHHAFVSQFAPNLYNNSAVFLLGLFTNNYFVGLYTAATKVIDALLSFAYILSNTFLPYLSRKLEKHKIFQKIMLVSGLLLTVIVFSTAEVIARLLFSLDNLDVAVYIRWLAVSIIFIFGFLAYNSNYLMISGHEKIAKNISLYVSLAAFLWTLLLVYLYGVTGAIISMLLARFSLSALSFFYYRKIEG